MVASHPDRSSWTRPDESEVARVGDALARLEQLKSLELTSGAEINLKIIAPVNSSHGAWEADWDGGHLHTGDEHVLLVMVLALLHNA